MKLYQLEDGVLINLDRFCVIEQVEGQWEIAFTDRLRYALSDADARNLQDKTLLDFDFMAE